MNNEIELNDSRNEERRGNYSSGILGRISLFDFFKVILTFILFSWVPFYGYMYLNSRLMGIGYESVFIGLDIWEGVYYFLISATELFDITYIDTRFAVFCFVMAVLMFIAWIISLLLVRYESEIITMTEPVRKVILSSQTLLGLFFSLAFGLALYLLPIVLGLIFIILFFFSVLGNFNGTSDGKEVLVETKCIYGKPSSGCAIIKINGEEKIGHVEYQNEKHTFFISNDGRYYLSANREINQYKPFTIDISNYAKNSINFDSDVWSSHVKKRWSMLKILLDEINDIGEVNRNDIIDMLGESESTGTLKFHYKEFPVYKLSKKTDCAIAFPYDWKDEIIINTILFGNCEKVFES